MNTSLFVSKQLPQYITEDSPKFVDFLRAYYTFLDQMNVDLMNLKNIDSLDEELLSFLKQELAPKFPTAAIDDRRFLSIINSIFKKKGTLSAIELLFRVFYDEAVIISQPNENIIKASDGKWFQESALMLTTVYGSFDETKKITLRFENNDGVYTLPIERVKRLDANRTMFYFRTFRSFLFNENQQYMDILTDDGTSVQYRGLLTKSPSTLNIMSGGAAWKVGQVFKIPGNIEDSICRVIKVGNNGEMQSAEVMSYGYNHTQNSVALISPYPNKPLGNGFTIDYTIVSYDALTETYTYEYDVGFDDYFDMTSEYLVGLSDTVNGNSYFLEDYLEQSYNGQVVLENRVDSTGISTESVLSNPEITQEQWFNSRAAIIFNFDYIVRQRGYYLDNKGQISDQEIRMQDNYFYQLFSYVIESSTEIEDYRNVINLLHPAGMKLFSNLGKSVQIDLTEIIEASVA